MSENATPPRLRTVFDSRFVKGFQIELGRLLSLKMTLVEYRVFLHLVCSCRYLNRVDGVQIKALAVALGHDRTTVGNSLKSLAAKGVIRRHTDPETGYPFITLNPWLTFKGDPLARGEAISAGWVRPCDAP